MDEFLAAFTATTIDVLSTGGFDNYLPTLAVPSQATVTVIEGIPPEESHTKALIEMIERQSLSDEELLFAVKTSANTVVAGHYVPGAASQFVEITKVGEEFRQRALESCDWWTVASGKRAN